MSNWSNINSTFLYDGTFEGFLSTVFYAFEMKQIPYSIVHENEFVYSIINDTTYIDTDFSKSSRIFDGLLNISEYILYYTNNVFNSNFENKGLLLLKYIIFAFQYGPNVNTMLSIPEVLQVQKISKAYCLEIQRLKGFIRFSEIAPNMFLSEIETDNNIVEILGNHFKKRFSNQNLIIHDKKRKLACIYNTKDIIVVSSENLNIPEVSEKEKEWKDLWTMFFKNIAIKERINPRLQKQYMPKRYWKYIFETK